MNLQKYCIYTKGTFLKVLILSLLIMQIGCRQFRDKEKDDAVAGCDAASCHPTSPIGHYPPESGRHSVHLGYLERIGNDNPCLVCHTDYINNNHHKDGVLDKDLETKIVYFDVERSNTGWENLTSDCSNIVCHGNSNANWKIESGGCTLCHNEESIIEPGGTGVSGKHTPHVTDGGVSCETCHYGYKEQSSHINGVFANDENVNFVIFNTDGSYNGESVSATFDSSDKSCEAISCHGGSGNVNWNRDLNGCTDCHAPGSSIDMFYTGGSGADGKHTAHVADQGIECDSCHSGYYDQNSHLDGALNNGDNLIVFGGVYNNISVSATDYDGGTKGCDTISCHGGTGTGIIEWDRTAAINCTDCHVEGSNIDPRVKNDPTSNGKHTKHLDLNYVCEKCHNGYRSQPTHINGTYGTDETNPFISFDSTNSSASWNDSITTCSSLLCHPDQDWYTASSPSFACQDCHVLNSGITYQDGPPDPNASGASSHSEHMAANADCATSCHNNYSPTANHKDGTLNTPADTGTMISFSGGGSFDDGTNQCSGTVCHGSATPEWGNAASVPCGSCHTPSEFPPTSGAHTRHVTDIGYSCSECHNGAGSGTANHANGTVDVAFNSTLNPSADPYETNGANICSNLYCHGNFTGGNTSNEANWTLSGSGSGGYCGECHADPPTSNAHTKHIGGGANYSFSCDQCHDDGLAANHHYVDSMPVNGTVNIVFDSQADQGPGTIATYNGANKQCSNTYCHGDFPGGKASNIPDWNGGTGGACGDCHANAPDNADYGSHDKHTNASSYNYNCSLCHNGIASGTESSPPSLTAITDHVNFTKNVFFSGIADQDGTTAALWNSSTKECANTYCHGDMDGGLSSNTPDWDAGTGGACGNCHDNAPLNGTFGAHNKHTDAASGHNYECIQCHGTVTASGIKEGSVFNDAAFGSGRYVDHVDGNYTVAFSTTLADKTDTQGGTGATYNDAGNTCSNTYCHGDFDEGIANTPDWDAGTGGACGNCHNNAPQNGTFGSHDIHTDSTASGKNYECSLCHAAVTASGIQEGSTFDDTAFGTSRWTTHLNGSPDISFTGIADQAPDTKANTTASYNSSLRQCSDTYCHGDFDEGIANTPDWDAGTGGACGNCHDNAPQNVTFGRHDKHTDTATGHDYNCSLCHDTVTAGTSSESAGVSFGTSRFFMHANGTPDISFTGIADQVDTQGGTGAAYTTSGKTCADTYCHGDFDEGSATNTPDWDAGTGGACGNCHNNAPANTDYGYHDKHTNTSGNSGHNYDCTYCHNTVTASGIKEGSTFDDAAFGSARWTDHANGSPTVPFTTTLADKTDTQGGSAAGYNSGTKTCSNTYCHGDFDEGIANTPNWTHLSGSGGSCGDCHNNAPQNAEYGVHNKHTDTATYNYACQLCHNGSVTDAAVKEGIGSWSNATELDQTARWASHVNGSPTVNFTGQADQYTGTSASYTVGTETCNLTYCHGAFGSGSTQWLEGNDGTSGKALNAPTWTTGSTAPCGSCHGDGANQALGVPTASNIWESSGESHAKHAGYNAESGYNYPCGFCHEGVYDATISAGNGTGGAYETGTKTPAYTQHADGARTTLNFYTTFTTTGSAVGNALQDMTCSNLYCHSDGWDPAALSYEPSGAVTSPRWGGASKSTITCTSCHNGSDNVSGADSSNLAPDEVDGTTSGPWPRYGTHHDPSSDHEVACDHCHDNTTDSTGEGETNNSMVYTANRHVNRYKNVKFDASEITITDDYVRNATGGQCDITCHGRDHSYNSYKWYKNTDNKGTLIYE